MLAVLDFALPWFQALSLFCHCHVTIRRGQWGEPRGPGRPRVPPTAPGPYWRLGPVVKRCECRQWNVWVIFKLLLIQVSSFCYFFFKLLVFVCCLSRLCLVSVEVLFKLSRQVSLFYWVSFDSEGWSQRYTGDRHGLCVWVSVCLRVCLSPSRWHVTTAASAGARVPAARPPVFIVEVFFSFTIEFCPN